MGRMHKLDSTGDTKHEWDPNNPAEVEAAQEVFESYLRSGFTAARMEADGSTGEITREFDQHAGVFLMLPPMTGG